MSPTCHVHIVVCLTLLLTGNQWSLQTTSISGASSWCRSLCTVKRISLRAQCFCHFAYLNLLYFCDNTNLLPLILYTSSSVCSPRWFVFESTSVPLHRLYLRANLLSKCQVCSLRPSASSEGSHLLNHGIVPSHHVVLQSTRCLTPLFYTGIWECSRGKADICKGTWTLMVQGISAGADIAIPVRLPR